MLCRKFDRMDTYWAVGSRTQSAVGLTFCCCIPCAYIFDGLNMHLTAGVICSVDVSYTFI